MNPFQNRRSIVAAAVILIFAVMAFRLFQVQILKKEYRVTAENNALKYETIYPARGRILDRNGEVLVDNKLTYDIMVTPFDVKEFDTLAFCRIFDLDTGFVHEKFREYRMYRTRIGYQTLVFKRQVTGEQYNMFIEKSFLFPGFTGAHLAHLSVQCRRQPAGIHFGSRCELHQGAPGIPERRLCGQDRHGGSL